ncbi:hypothetical protein TWF694_000934 [Orbilia ellipsospora]|uniref:Uncharacterized protein n=1 Tax=Orbilia ellipsospora TaxID=2528407 RepID=A0AAV9XQJ2_9PEZI
MCRIEILMFENCFHRDACVKWCSLPYGNPSPIISCPLDREDAVYVTDPQKCDACVRYHKLEVLDKAEFRYEVTVVMEGRFQTFRNWEDGERIALTRYLAMEISDENEESYRRMIMSECGVSDGMRARGKTPLQGMTNITGELRVCEASDEEGEEKESGHGTNHENVEP